MHMMCFSSYIFLWNHFIRIHSILFSKHDQIHEGGNPQGNSSVQDNEGGTEAKRVKNQCSSARA